MIAQREDVPPERVAGPERAHGLEVGAPARVHRIVRT
jgi:hypothetical protein